MGLRESVIGLPNPERHPTGQPGVYTGWVEIGFDSPATIYKLTTAVFRVVGYITVLR